MSYSITDRQRVRWEELRTFHFKGCTGVNWKSRLEPPFPKDGVGPKEKVWSDRVRTYSPSKFASWLFIHKGKLWYWERKARAGYKKDLFTLDAWEKDLPFVQQVVVGDVDAWREAVRKHANFQYLPLAHSFSLHSHSPDIAECDVRMPSLSEVIPNTIEKMTKRGSVRYHPFPKTKQIDLYREFIYSGAAKIAQDLLSILPCKTLYLNVIVKDPILSMILDRKALRIQSKAERVVKSGRWMESFKKRSGFHPLDYVYCPLVMGEEQMRV